MTRLKGKVKSISVKNVTEGMQVGWEGATRFHFGKTEKVVDKVYVKVNLETTNGHDTVPIDLLKTLIVEYEKDCGDSTCRGGDVDECPICRTSQLPLKHSQWQSAIDNGELDTDKEVEFEIKDGFVHGGEGEITDRFSIRYAKIIPQKKRSDQGTTEEYQDMKDVIEFISKYVLTASDGGHIWCEIRTKEGSQEWFKKLKKLNIGNHLKS